MEHLIKKIFSIVVFVSVVTLQAASTPTKSGNSVNSKETSGNEEFIKRIEAILRHGDIARQRRVLLGQPEYEPEYKYKPPYRDEQVLIEVLVVDEDPHVHLDKQADKKS